MLAVAQLTQITYQPNSIEWFKVIRHLPMAIWLDSGRPNSHYGRFDILSAAPSIKFETNGQETRITKQNGTSEYSNQNPFKIIEEHLIPTTSLKDTPFSGGALGYFAYDLGRRLEDLPQQTIQDIKLPDMCVGIYPWAIIQDHENQLAWIITNTALAPTYDFFEIENLIKSYKPNSKKKENIFFKIKQFIPQISADDYQYAFNKINTYIQAGDCYQVNFAQRFSAKYQGDSLTAYLTLREALASPFSAFMQLEQGSLLSLSPERFIKIKGDQVETKPIKGTIARGATLQEDNKNIELLSNSKKDQAENVMIVDLLRNDLSKTCIKVKVPELFSLQSFANVHHLVSKVTGQLKSSCNPTDVLASSFPGGSITGAPKIRAMEIIEELEISRRSLYCGSIGYISSCGNMDTNIAIRTLVCTQDQIHCWGGGGIVADSHSEDEYQESIAKIKILMHTLEQNFLDT